MVDNANKKSSIEDLLDKIRLMSEKLKEDKHTGQVVFRIELDYNQGGIRNRKTKFLVDI